MFVRAALIHPKPSLEPERQAHIHEFQQLDIVAGVLLEPCKQVVEAVAADCLAMERADHRLQSPARLATPGGVQHDIVQRRAERIARRLDRLGRDPCLQGAVLEGAHLGHHRLAKLVRIHVLRTIAHPADQGEKRRRAGIEPVHPSEDLFRGLLL